MTRRYTTTLSLSIGGDIPTWEGEAEVSWTMLWGSPATRDDPGGGDDVDDIRVERIDGGIPTRAEAETLVCHIECNNALLDELIREGREQAAEDHAYAMERRAEARRDDAMIEDMERRTGR